VDKHEDNGGITESILGEERKGIGMVEELVTKGPIDEGS
jgi:hypothetical protein